MNIIPTDPVEHVEPVLHSTPERGKVPTVFHLSGKYLQVGPT